MTILKFYFFFVIFLHILTLGYVLAKGDADSITTKLLGICLYAPLFYICYKFLF